MPNISFGYTFKVTLPTKHHGDVTLSKAKWEKICSEPERYYYPLNGEKIATTLINPDVVRHHRTEPSQYFYYKNFPSIELTPGTNFAPRGGIYFAVVIDEGTKRVCTCYPVTKPKPGREFKPRLKSK